MLLGLNESAHMLTALDFRRLGLLIVTLLVGATSYSAQCVLGQPPVVPQTSGTAQNELWYGTLDTELRRFRFAVELTPSDSGSWTGSLLSLDEGDARFDLANVVRQTEQLAFEITSTAAEFSGSLSSANKIATGKWNQRGKSLDLTLERVEEIPTQQFRALWAGQLNAVIQKLDIAILELENGEALLNSVSQKASGFVGQFTRDGEQVAIRFPALNAEFNGTANPAGQTLSGKWKQGVVSLDLVLSKSDRLQVKPLRRPQTPQAPFPYEIRQVEFENGSAEIRLSGTLTLPAEAKPAPAVVLISGSGPQDRDETIAEHRPFAVLADYFTRSGLAVLRFDDRGVGQSQGDFSQATSVDFASDVAAAVACLRSQSEIDGDRIALCGHSEGGIIAPLVASQDATIAGIVLLAGSGVNGARILTSQNRLLLEEAGSPPAELERQLAIQQAFIDVALQSPAPTVEEFKTLVEKALESQLSELDDVARDQLISSASAQLRSPWFQFFLKHEPADVLTRVACPVLALCGERDLQVDPELNLPAIEAALIQGKNKDFRIEVLPGLNHLFQTCTSGAVSEYGEIEETIAPLALEITTTWLVDHLK